MKKIDGFDLTWALITAIGQTGITIACIQNPLVKSSTDPTWLKVAELVIWATMITMSVINIVKAAMLRFYAERQKEEEIVPANKGCYNCRWHGRCAPPTMERCGINQLEWVSEDE